MIWLGLSLAGKVLVASAHLGREQDKTEMARWEQVAPGEVWAQGYRGPPTIAK